ncbi:hypothetical protein DL93DRAFT_1972021 [Clavulina sp. PMI_390]|nr:hypothetical protein DL93DRAFT_1972021 [Clavulina sp. PMI_390]
MMSPRKPALNPSLTRVSPNRMCGGKKQTICLLLLLPVLCCAAVGFFAVDQCKALPRRWKNHKAKHSRSRANAGRKASDEKSSTPLGYRAGGSQEGSKSSLFLS